MSAKHFRVAKIITSPPPLYAAIDLGTNSCRLLIVKATPIGISVVDAYSKSVGLGESLNKTGLLSKDAKERTITSLKTIKNKLRKHNIIYTRAVATEACRQAKNGQDFLDEIKEKIGIEFEIIDNNEEAILASEGCKSLLPKDTKNALIFDIGGGSTQLTWLHDNKIVDTLSIPYGVVTLTDKIDKDFLTPEQFRKNVILIQNYMEDFYKKHATDSYSILGTSGTITTLTATILNLRTYNRSKVDGRTVSQKKIVDITKTLAFMPPKERCRIPCIGAERAHLMMAGCVILNAICTKWKTNTILVADRGIREGILLKLTQSEKNNGK